MNHTTKQALGRQLLAVAALALAGSSPLVLTHHGEGSTARDLNGAGPSAAAVRVALPVGAWTLFEVGAPGTTSDVYTFTSDTPVLLRVTDAYCRGDTFRATDRGFPLFDTSTVATDPSCDDQPERDHGHAAWRDPSYGKGTFLLQPGRHSVRMETVTSPFSAAGAFLRIDKRPAG